LGAIFIHPRQLGSWAGIIGSALFIAVFVLQDFLRPDYNWRSTAVSEHSIGPHGWIQIATFIVVGLLFLVFARGVAVAFQEGTASKFGPLLLAIIGVCILGSGPFVTDPAPVTIFSSRTAWHATVHRVLGAIGFTLMPVSCFIFFRRFRKHPKWKPLAGWTLAACIIIVLGIVLLKIGQLHLISGLDGVFQRIVLVAFFGWVFAFAVALGSTRTTSGNSSGL
jgi:hypothetical membrane protein